MTMQRHFGEHHDAIVALHGILTGTWAEKDPTSNIAKYPASYSETFLDMARAAVEAGYVPAAARIASIEAERDGAVAQFDLLRKVLATTTAPYPSEHEAALARIIAQSPADALAGVKAEAAATALEDGELPTAVQASVAYLKSMGYDDAAESLRSGWFIRSEVK